MPTRFSKPRRRLSSLIAATALAGTVTAIIPAAAAVAQVGPRSTSITFQASNLGDHDEFVVTFPTTAPALSHSDSGDGPVWAGSGKPVPMPGSHFVYLTGSGTNYPLAGSNPVTYALPNLKAAVLYDDSEGYLGISLGLDHSAAYTVSTSGDQVTVDVAH